MAAETKERILDVAERLFADFGFPVTSLRDITREAGVNLAAVNYHFGSKEALLAAVLERRFRPINDRRLALLDELEKAAGGASPELEDILRAFLGPPFYKQAEWGDCGKKVLKLVGHIHSETNQELRVELTNQFEGVLARFTTAIQRALPDLDSDEADRRIRFIRGSMAFTMMWEERMVPRGHQPTQDPERLLESLVRFSVAGMAAPSPALAPVSVWSKGGRA